MVNLAQDSEVDGGSSAAAPDAQSRNYIVVSSDTHGCPATFDEFLSYVDPNHRAEIESYGAIDLSRSVSTFGAIDPGLVDEPDPIRHAAIKKAIGLSIDAAAAKDWFELYSADLMFPDDAGGRRLAALEQLGVHAEVTHPNPHLAGSLPRSLGNLTSLRREGPPELLWPALHAYNRWLADFCSAAPGRRAGIIQVSMHDMDATVQEIAWARSAGIFGGVGLPPMNNDLGLPPYSDSYYEPFWSACEEHGTVINVHTGGDPTPLAQAYDPEHGAMIAMYETFLFSRRPLWFMVLSGVFDRHPKLKVVMAENGLQWYPALIRDLELVYNGHAGGPIRARLKLSPSEYFRNHIWLAGSLMQRKEAELREDIGTDRMMWGSDYPHLEGGPPVHREVMRYVLGGLPEDDVRRILGKTATDLWGFDEEQLQAVADRVGPTVAELAQPIETEEIHNSFSWNVPRRAPVVSRQ